MYIVLFTLLGTSGKGGNQNTLASNNKTPLMTMTNENYVSGGSGRHQVPRDGNVVRKLDRQSQLNRRTMECENTLQQRPAATVSPTKFMAGQGSLDRGSNSDEKYYDAVGDSSAGIVKESTV